VRAQTAREVCTRCRRRFDPRYPHGCRVEHDFKDCRRGSWDGLYTCSNCRGVFDGDQDEPFVVKYDDGYCFEGDHTTESQRCESVCETRERTALAATDALASFVARSDDDDDDDDEDEDE